jgi:hypothetical protein
LKLEETAQMSSTPSKKREGVEMDAQAIVVKTGECHSSELRCMAVGFDISGVKTRGAFAVVEHQPDLGNLAATRWDNQLVQSRVA